MPPLLLRSEGTHARESKKICDFRSHNRTLLLRSEGTHARDSKKKLRILF